jgi:hypothetical protein
VLHIGKQWHLCLRLLQLHEEIYNLQLLPASNTAGIIWIAKHRLSVE